MGQIGQHPTYNIVNRNFVFMAFVATCVFLGIFYYQPHVIVSESILLFQTNEEFVYHSGGQFLIYNKKCRMPELDPMNPEVRLFYKKYSYNQCSKTKLLTYIEKDGFNATLFIDRNATKQYTKYGVSCCYSNVTRKNDTKDPDNHVSISSCEAFNDGLPMTNLPVLISCNDTKTGKEVYTNIHAAITLTPNVSAKIDAFQASKSKQDKPLSLLIIGVDSISRLNMMRVLPKTREYLVNNNWLEMKSYNKIGDNTFPNLMGILTGKNETVAYEECNPRDLGRLDTCNFLWKDYSKFGYITGYAEDAGSISSFNYKKKGFTNEPVDYYLRPYILGAEKLKIVVLDGMSYCAGPESEGERILNVAKDFTKTFMGLPSFGFFWMNTFSHNELNSPTRFDDVLLKFFKHLKSTKILEDTAVIFLSDHGLRFGDIRYTRTGWLEERLPYLWISLPSSFKKQHPESFQNLQTNTERLVTPYDLHMTLQDLLVHSGQNHTIQPSNGCPNCQSLFQPVPYERSCEEANIDIHWCTCTGYKYLNPGNDTVLAASNFILDELGKISKSSDEGKKCAKFSIKRVMSSSLSVNYDNWYKNATYLLVVMKTIPGGVFEATVSVEDISDDMTTFNLQGGISRLDMYSSHSHCVKSAYLKKYCYCK